VEEKLVAIRELSFVGAAFDRAIVWPSLKEYLGSLSLAPHFFPSVISVLIQSEYIGAARAVYKSFWPLIIVCLFLSFLDPSLVKLIIIWLYSGFLEDIFIVTVG